MKQKKRLIFEIKNLIKVYGSTEVINIGRLDIHPGTIYGVVGNVSSGKTTLLKLLSGNIKPTDGLLYYENNPYKTNWLGKLVPNAEIFFSNNTGLYNSRSTVKNFIFDTFGNKKNVIQKRYFNKGSFKSIWQRNISKLTKGEMHWLGMLLAIENDPRVLLIDDYGIYFDSSMENNFRSQLLNMNRRLGTTIILTAPGDRYLRKFCSVLVYLDNGHISRIRPGIARKVNKKHRKSR